MDFEKTIVKKAEVKKKIQAGKSSKAMKYRVFEYLAEHQGSDPLEVWNALRPDTGKSDRKKRNSMASEFTYLKDEDYLVVEEDGKRFAVAMPHPENKDEHLVLKGQMARYKAL